MASISLVLPFALPVPEFAPDLIRALQAPALAALLSRTSAQTFHRLPAAARALPHELWIADALGLAQGQAPAVATAVMRALGLDPGDGTWFVLNPAHIQIASTHLMMADPRQLGLREDEARALFDSAAPECAAAGLTLVYGSADTWFVRADAWRELKTASLDAAVGMNLTDWMPIGEAARAFRKLQNEVQVTWFADPVNAAREARGQAPVNAIWPWGGADAQDVTRGAPSTRPALVTHAVPGWLDALATRRAATPAELLAGIEQAGDTPLLLVAGTAASPAIGADWDGWLRALQALEAAVFAPLLDGVRAGRIKQLRLVLSHRDGHLDTITTPMAQRKFWRGITLESLT